MMQHLDADPNYVQAQAIAITTAAAEIQDASRKLFGLGYGEFQSEAVDAFQTNVRQLATTLDDAWARYAAAGHALTTYAPVLRYVQEEIDSAISVVSHADVNGASHQAEIAHLHAITNNLNPFASESDKDEANLVAARAKAHLEQQQAVVANAEASYLLALNDLRAAATIAAHQIENGIEMSSLNDTFWDHVQQVMDDIHTFLTEALAIAHRILSDLSTLLTVVGGVIVLIGILTAQPWVVAAGVGFLKAAGIVSLLDAGVELARYLNGDISFGEMMSTVLVAVASFLFTKLGTTIAAKIGGKMGAEAVDKLFPAAMKDAEIDAGKETIGAAVGQGTGLSQDPLENFINDHVHVPNAVHAYLSHGQWQVPYTSKDVNQLTPDFSNINVQTIMNSAVTDASQTSPLLVTVSASTGVA